MEFTIVMRGYDREQVQDFLQRVQAIGSLDELPEFTVVLRGYDRQEVDAHFARFLGAPAAPQPAVAIRPSMDFTVVIRGYDRDEVNDYLRRVDATGGAHLAVEPNFRVSLRGYDREQVTHFLGMLRAHHAQTQVRSPEADR